MALPARAEEEVRRILYHPNSFSRLDEEDDAAFYETDRFVQHLDAVALETVRDVIGTLVVERAPKVLDLMASFDSHLPPGIQPETVVGLGMNRAELEANEALDAFELADLNAHPRLPFGDASFDVVLNTVSVDYLTKPFAVFSEVARVLKPGGLHLVIFSNRMFRTKAVRIWREASEEERVLIVEDYFRATDSFGPVSRYLSKGRLRPEDDKYAGQIALSDPVYAVWAEKLGEIRHAPRPVPVPKLCEMPDEQVLERRKARTKHTGACPYCERPMSKWQVPLSPFSEWGAEFLFICMNDSCPYVQRGWNAMDRQGIASTTYRCTYDPERDAFMPMPVPSLRALQDGLVDE